VAESMTERAGTRILGGLPKLGKKRELVGGG